MKDDGFAAPLMLVLLAVVGLLCIAAADAANVLTSRARAQTAADAAALAAASAAWPFLAQGDAAAAARSAAESNGATLESCECPARGTREVVVVSMATRIRMLGVAPRRVSARAEAGLDAGRMFSPP